MCEFCTHAHGVYNVKGNSELAECSYRGCFHALVTETLGSSNDMKLK